MSTVLTMEGLTDITTSMARGSPPFVCVGIVCSPEGMQTLNGLYRGPSPSPLCPTLYGLPLYRKVGQEQPFRAFYDEGELARYLNP